MADDVLQQLTFQVVDEFFTNDDFFPLEFSMDSIPESVFPIEQRWADEVEVDACVDDLRELDDLANSASDSDISSPPGSPMASSATPPLSSPGVNSSPGSNLGDGAGFRVNIHSPGTPPLGATGSENLDPNQPGGSAGLELIRHGGDSDGIVNSDSPPRSPRSPVGRGGTQSLQIIDSQVDNQEKTSGDSGTFHEGMHERSRRAGGNIPGIASLQGVGTPPEAAGGYHRNITPPDKKIDRSTPPGGRDGSNNNRDASNTNVNPNTNITPPDNRVGQLPYTPSTPQDNNVTPSGGNQNENINNGERSSRLNVRQNLNFGALGGSDDNSMAGNSISGAGNANGNGAVKASSSSSSPENNSNAVASNNNAASSAGSSVNTSLVSNRSSLGGSGTAGSPEEQLIRRDRKAGATGSSGGLRSQGLRPQKTRENSALARHEELKRKKEEELRLRQLKRQEELEQSEREQTEREQKEKEERNERIEKERERALEKEREKERLERESRAKELQEQERERILQIERQNAATIERERIEREKIEREKIEREKLEKERLDKEQKMRREALEREKRIDRDRIEQRERIDLERKKKERMGADSGDSPMVSGMESTESVNTVDASIVGNKGTASASGSCTTSASPSPPGQNGGNGGANSGSNNGGVRSNANNGGGNNVNRGSGAGTPGARSAGPRRSSGGSSRRPNGHQSPEVGKEKLEKALKVLGIPEDAAEQKVLMGKMDSEKVRIVRFAERRMDIERLTYEKKRVKDQLKVYDESFERDYGEPPARRDKEPMRPLYTYYREIKSLLDKATAEADKNGGTTNAGINGPGKDGGNRVNSGASAFFGGENGGKGDSSRKPANTAANARVESLLEKMGAKINAAAAVGIVDDPATPAASPAVPPPEVLIAAETQRQQDASRQRQERERVMREQHAKEQREQQERQMREQHKQQEQQKQQEQLRQQHSREQQKLQEQKINEQKIKEQKIRQMREQQMQSQQQQSQQQQSQQQQSQQQQQQSLRSQQGRDQEEGNIPGNPRNEGGHFGAKPRGVEQARRERELKNQEQMRMVNKQVSSQAKSTREEEEANRKRHQREQQNALRGEQGQNRRVAGMQQGHQQPLQGSGRNASHNSNNVNPSNTQQQAQQHGMYSASELIPQIDGSTLNRVHGIDGSSSSLRIAGEDISGNNSIGQNLSGSTATSVSVNSSISRFDNVGSMNSQNGAGGNGITQNGLSQNATPKSIGTAGVNSSMGVNTGVASAGLNTRNKGGLSDHARQQMQTQQRLQQQQKQNQQLQQQMLNQQNNPVVMGGGSLRSGEGRDAMNHMRDQQMGGSGQGSHVGQGSHGVAGVGQSKQIGIGQGGHQQKSLSSRQRLMQEEREQQREQQKMLQERKEAMLLQQAIQQQGGHLTLQQQQQLQRQQQRQQQQREHQQHGSRQPHNTSSPQTRHGQQHQQHNAHLHHSGSHNQQAPSTLLGTQSDATSTFDSEAPRVANSFRSRMNQAQLSQEEINEQIRSGVGLGELSAQGGKLDEDLGKLGAEGGVDRVDPMRRSAVLEQNEARRRLKALFEEKNTIREKLQKYQDGFLAENKRKIRFHKDILPIEKEYRAYKHLKQEIEKCENILRRNGIPVKQSNRAHSGDDIGF